MSTRHSSRTFGNTSRVHSHTLVPTADPITVPAMTALAFLLMLMPVATPPPGQVGTALNAKICDVSGASQRLGRAVLGAGGRRSLAASDTTVEAFDAKGTPFGGADCVFIAYDARFLRLIGGSPTLTLLASSDEPLFHEAAVWLPRQQAVLVTSNRLGDLTGAAQSVVISLVSMRTGEVTRLAPEPPILMANGGTGWTNGRVLLADQGRGDQGGSVVILDPTTAKVERLVDNFHGLPFSSPNDVAVSPKDGSVYFTDPPYGFHQKYREAPKLAPLVWRVDPTTRQPRAVADDLQRPNGLAFSHDGKRLYLTETAFIPGDGTAQPLAPHTIYSFDVDYAAAGALTGRRLFAHVDAGIPDGLKVDIQGNVWAGCGDGVQVFEPKGGELLGKIRPASSEGVTNLVFAEGGRLVLLAEKRIYVATTAAR